MERYSTERAVIYYLNILCHSQVGYLVGMCYDVSSGIPVGIYDIFKTSGISLGNVL